MPIFSRLFRREALAVLTGKPFLKKITEPLPLLLHFFQKFKALVGLPIHPYPPEFPLIIHGRHGVKQKEMDRLSATLDGHEMIKVVGEDLSRIFKGSGGWTLHFLKELLENFIHPFF